MAPSSVPLWKEAETECKRGNFPLAAASFHKCFENSTPVAAAGAVLTVSRHSDVGFNGHDIRGHKLARAILRGDHLTAKQTKICRGLASRYATQALTKVWGAGGYAGAKRLRLLFEGRDPWTGAALHWGHDEGADEALEVGGVSDSGDEVEADREEGDAYEIDGFVVPDDEGEAPDEAEPPS